LITNEEYIEDDECPTLNDELPGEDNDLVPKVGMKFNDENEVSEFYKRYAYHVGFPIKRRNLKKGDDRVVRYVGYTCSEKAKEILKLEPF